MENKLFRKTIAFSIVLTLLLAGTVFAGVPQFADTPGDNASTYVSDHAMFGVYAKWTIAGANLSAWVISENGTGGTWGNGTWTTTFGTGNWTNGTITTNTSWTDAEVIFWRIFVNDSTPAENATGLVSTSKIIVDTLEPTYVVVGDNSTTTAASKPVAVYANWSDSAAGMGQYKLSYNNSAGTWVNISTWTQTSEWSNTSITTTGFTAGVHGWKIYVRDNATGPNMNVTNVTTYTIEGTSPRYYTSGESTNTPLVGNPVNAYVLWNDTYALYQYRYSHNLSGTWANGTWTSFSGNWSNKTITPTTGGLFQWKMYARDYSSNENVSAARSLTATHSGAPGDGGGSASGTSPTTTTTIAPSAPGVEEPGALIDIGVGEPIDIPNWLIYVAVGAILFVIFRKSFGF